MSFGLALKLLRVTSKSASLTNVAKKALRFIKNMKAPIYKKGIFGYECQKSLPLRDFSKILEHKPSLKGKITPYGIGDVVLKDSKNVPLGTQGVFNCSYVCLFNSKTGTQGMHHVFAIDNQKRIITTLKKLMPEGFDKAFIVAGEAEGTNILSTKVFNAVRSLNKSVNIQFRHLNTETPVIVSYKNNVYELDGTLKDNIFRIPSQREYDAGLL